MPSNKKMEVINMPEDWRWILDPITPSRRAGGFSALVRIALKEYAAKNGIELQDTMLPLGGQYGKRKS